MTRFVRLLLLLFLSIHARAELVVLQPIADTALLEWLPTNNLGKSTRLRVGGQFAGRSRSLMKFDLSSISSTAKVVYAQVRLTIFYPPVEGDPYGGRNLTGTKLFRELRSWNEGQGAGETGQVDTNSGASWLFAAGADQPWYEPGGKYAAEWYYLESAFAGNGDTDGAVLSFSGTSLAQDVQGWVDDPLTNFGWMIYGASESSRACCYSDPGGGPLDYYPFSAVTFASREDEQNSPELIIGTGNPQAPVIFINGQYVDSPIADIDAPSLLTLASPFTDGRIFYTLDGSRPTVASERYTGPLPLNGGEIIRAITYNADYSVGGSEGAQIRVRALPEFPLNYASSSGAQGRVQINDAGVLLSDSQASGTFLIASNHLVTITAIAQAGFQFTSWSGDLSGTDSKLVFTMNRPITVTANFAPIPPPGPPLTARQVDSDFLVLQFPAQAKQEYHLQSSTNLQDWIDIKSYTNATGIVDTILPLDLSANRVFFRLLVR